MYFFLKHQTNVNINMEIYEYIYIYTIHYTKYTPKCQNTFEFSENVEKKKQQQQQFEFFIFYYRYIFHSYLVFFVFVW